MRKRKHGGELTPSLEGRIGTTGPHCCVVDVDEAVRRVVTRRGGHSRGLMPSITNGKPVPFESANERSFYQLLELSSAVRKYQVQASRERFLVNGKPTQYIPDVHIWLVDGSTLTCEVKPLAKCRVKSVAEKLAAARSHFAAQGRRFSVVTDEWLNEQPRKDNVEWLMYNRHACSLSDARRETLMARLADARPKTLDDLFVEVGEAQSWTLLGLGVIGIDLERPANPSAEIFLRGGHRHADFPA